MAKKIQGEDGKVYVEKKPFYKKWWFILLVVLIAFSVIGNIGKENSSSDTKSVKANEVQKEEKKEEKVYEKITVKKLLDDLEGNALKATEAYKGKDFEITGVLGNIDAQGAYVSLDPSADAINFTGVQAFIKNDEQKKVVAELSKGDKITVKGKIKDVGEVLGYSVDIDEIFKTEK